MVVRTALLSEPASEPSFGRLMLWKCSWCRGGGAHTGSRPASASSAVCRAGVPGWLPGQACHAGLPTPVLGLLPSGVLAPEAGSWAPLCGAEAFAGSKPQSAPSSFHQGNSFSAKVPRKAHDG